MCEEGLNQSDKGELKSIGARNMREDLNILRWKLDLDYKVQLIILLKPKLHFKLSVFLFLDVNQLSIAKMDTLSLVQFFERISEIRSKFLWSYFSDKVPQRTK